MPEEKVQNKVPLLVVEDDTEISYLLEFMLSREGYDVKKAMDGLEAIAAIDSMPLPKLVLLDIMLPYHDGFELIDYIRKKQDWANVPIVMLTAKSQEKDISRALNMGANDYVLKPFQPVELLARIRRFLK